MTLKPLSLSSKRLKLACALGLLMAFASVSDAQTEGEPAPVVMIDAGVEAAVEVAPAPAPVVEVAAEPAPAEEAAALASASDKPTALSKLATEVMNILIPAFLTLIGLLVAWILNWVRKRFRLNVTDQQIASWAGIADRAANRGAEWARNKAKDFTDGKTIPGPEVLEVAVDWAVDMGRAFNLPEIGREKLVGLIESNLYTKREDPTHSLPLELPKAIVVSEG